MIRHSDRNNVRVWMLCQLTPRTVVPIERDRSEATIPRTVYDVERPVGGVRDWVPYPMGPLYDTSQHTDNIQILMGGGADG